MKSVENKVELEVRNEVELELFTFVTLTGRVRCITCKSANTSPPSGPLLRSVTLDTSSRSRTLILAQGNRNICNAQSLHFAIALRSVLPEVY